ncbi:Uncharacterised protein [Vibrio cholerae]|nr:Uncharacterised protein [Vibrio cholerae]CSC60118.1 Uncharacterised protein [Vibrio cholerae]
MISEHFDIFAYLPNQIGQNHPFNGTKRMIGHNHHRPLRGDLFNAASIHLVMHIERFKGVTHKLKTITRGWPLLVIAL